MESNVGELREEVSQLREEVSFLRENFIFEDQKIEEGHKHHKKRILETLKRVNSNEEELLSFEEVFSKFQK